MEEWQEWQIRADHIAAELATEVDEMERVFLSDSTEFNYRGFWPRLRDLKERVRTAPAIRLEPKLDLERRLRVIGSRGYKAQEAAYARSSERKVELLARIAALRSTAEGEHSPRDLRLLRRDFDRMRDEFDSGAALVPPDRQSVWDAWREANQFAWQRLVGMWSENETQLREILDAARQQFERGNATAVRQGVAKFFDALKTREAKQDAVAAMKAEAGELRREADAIEERQAAKRSVPVQTPAPDTWRSELGRNRDLASRLSEELAALEEQVRESQSILEQAMLRGALVDKRRKLAELDRACRSLEQRIEQSEENPLIPVGQAGGI